ncbi:hypothetical protein PFLA_a2558 [Pseudoalteromonas flavipulchra NCIMB 2033 = ATCC BAA-314]|nr:hypothetical protein [Pseudoalteromonas flavipulchra NCIMB 2033 = ATCC BAA-314]
MRTTTQQLMIVEFFSFFAQSLDNFYTVSMLPCFCGPIKDQMRKTSPTSVTEYINTTWVL